VIGEEFFPVFVRCLAAALDVSYAFVTERVPERGTKFRILAGWEKTGWGTPFEYESAKTPCGIVLRDGVAFYSADVQRAFPDDQHLIDADISSYLGSALFSSTNEIIGHVYVMDSQPLKNEAHAVHMLNIFAARAAAELERLHTTAALRQSEARQALILNTLPIAFYTAKATGNFGATWSSDNVELLTGFASDRFVEDGRFWAARLHPDDRERVLADVRRSPEVGVLSTEYRWQIADGSYRWYLDNAVYTGDAHGKPEQLIGSWIDITRRKRAEEALRESEERFKAFMDHNPAVIFMKDEQGRYVYVNREFERTLRVQVNDWLGKTDDDLWPHHTAERFRNNDQQVFASNAVLDTTETTVDTAGERRFWRVIKFPVKDEAGTRYLGGIAIDITERKQAQEALRESQERLTLCIQGSEAGIWDWDIRKQIVYLSPRWKHMLGYEDSEIDNRWEEWETRIHPADRERSLHDLHSYMEGQQSHFQLEHRLRYKDGSYRWILSHAVCLRDEQGKPYRITGSHLDITSLKTTQEQLQSALTRLRTVSGRLEVVREEERGRIARELHDEFGVGLTCLKIDLSRLRSLIGETIGLEKGRQIDEKIRSMGEFIDTTIGGVQRIVSELRPAILDDLGLVAAMEWQAQDFQRRTGIACSLRVDKELLDVDSERATVVFRICQEALTNVVRHAGATAVAIRLEERQGLLTLEIHDNGHGITEEKLADPQSLGLLGMRERAGLFGGSVTIAGGPDAGTFVTLHLRCSQASPAVEGSC
jgi:PAS domain S-box-containing protein